MLAWRFVVSLRSKKKIQLRNLTVICVWINECKKCSCAEKRPLFLYILRERNYPHHECMTYTFCYTHRKRIDCKHATLEISKMPVPFPIRLIARSHIAFKNRSNTIDDDKYSKTWPPFVELVCNAFFSYKTRFSY